MCTLLLFLSHIKFVVNSEFKIVRILLFQTQQLLIVFLESFAVLLSLLALVGTTKLLLKLFKSVLNVQLLCMGYKGTCIEYKYCKRDK